MDYIKIPVPNFRFEDVIKRRANDFIEFYLSKSILQGIYKGYRGNEKDTLSHIQDEWSKFSSSDGFIFVSTLLNHILEIESSEIAKSKSQLEAITKSKNLDIEFISVIIEYQPLLDSIKYQLYTLAEKSGFRFSADSFQLTEIASLNTKIDSILDSLETLKAGQEVVYNHIDELKEEFSSLKTDYILGKKKWHQRAAGVVATYSGTLVADSLFDPVKPLIHDLLSSTGTDVVQRLLDIK
ncbi:hypothetical protein DYU05_15375 [Mucilaginibacter terrenus]|uniref:Uncharacterized protein n=1 Tax=Mucilaginibacter terrenus TaxID=2482727 RepID=A0A3E2NLZ0_9SPHI|nr:hypothetical protein [Mucilaginibacter terrenus]RFZ82009.1 hypothetical protein DYU05_15375 [Mucilaginibacter terrenus]